MVFEGDQDRIDREASFWLVTREEGGLSRDQQREFDGWLAADARHGATYADMQTIWTDIPALTGLADLAPGLPAPPRPRRWAGIAVLGAMAASLVAYVALTSDLLSPASRYTTQLAQTRLLRLPDGSTVELGAKSSIRISFAANERRVLLNGGEAYFDVVHNPARPFVVEAGGATVRDVGTRFIVNVSSQSVRVAVVQGRVEIIRGNAVGPQQLAAGQRTELLAGAQDGALVVAPASGSAAWRDGRLVYDNVRLADVAADVNRYYAPGVTLARADVGDLRVTASFTTQEIPAFISALSATLPVEAERQGDGGFILRRIDR